VKQLYKDGVHTMGKAFPWQAWQNPPSNPIDAQ